MRPLRHRSLGALRRAVAATAGLQPRVGLLGAAVGDHPDLVTPGASWSRRAAASPSSLRLDRLDPDLLDLLAAAGTRTATFAPETGSERLRCVVGKRIGDGQILDAASGRPPPACARSSSTS